MLKTPRRPWRPWRGLNVICATPERPRPPFCLLCAFNGDLSSFVVAQWRHNGRSPCVKGVLSRCDHCPTVVDLFCNLDDASASLLPNLGDLWGTNLLGDIERPFILNTFKDYGDQMKKKNPRHWSFVRGIHRSPVNSPHRGQWRGAWCFLSSAPE